VCILLVLITLTFSFVTSIEKQKPRFGNHLIPSSGEIASHKKVDKIWEVHHQKSHARTETGSFRNVVFCFWILVTVENVLINVGDITHVTSVSKIHMLQLYSIQFRTQHCGPGR